MEQQTEFSGNQRLKDLQRQLDELKKSWPAHSVPAAMLERLDELEEELEIELQKVKAESSA